MKKAFSLLLALVLALELTACGGSASADEADAERIEVVVFAAASLEATLTEIADLYQETAPNVDLVFSFDSSGTLRTQLKEGAVCDLFLSAGQKQMDELDITADPAVNTDGTDLVVTGSRVDFVENKVVLAVPDDDSAGIQSYEDLASDKLTLLCIGNADVPVGGYSLQILDSLGIDLAALVADGKVTYGSNVTEVAAQVKEGVVDAGIVYATDAFTYGLTVVDEATADLCGQVIYPAAVMKSGTEAAAQAARDFLDFLRTDKNAIAVLEGVGFTVLK